MDGHFTNPMLGFQPELPGLEDQRPQQQHQPQQQPQQQQQQPGGSGGGNFQHRPKTSRRGQPSKEGRTEREARYDRIEALTRELSFAVRDEMARRKNLWDVEGDREEEEFWESRKKQVYAGLEGLAGEIQRALRDRQKEAVMEMWSKEQEEKRASSSGSGARLGRSR